MRRKNADHRAWLTAQCEGAAEDSGIGAETSLPQAMAQYHHLGLPRLIFILGEGAAQGGANTEDGKEGRRDARALQLFRFSRAGQRDGSSETDRGHAFEDGIPILPVEVVERGDAVA